MLFRSTLAEENINALAVRTLRTAGRNARSTDFLLTREAVVRSIASAVDRQKRNAAKNERAKTLSFEVNDLVLLSTVNLPKHVVTNVGSSKLLTKFIGPFRVMHRVGNAYTLELPPRMRTHPKCYVGRLRPYHHFEASSDEEEAPTAQESQGDSCDPESELQSDSAPVQAHHKPKCSSASCRVLPRQAFSLLQLSLLNLMQN